VIRPRRARFIRGNFARPFVRIYKRLAVPARTRKLRSKRSRECATIRNSRGEYGLAACCTLARRLSCLTGTSGDPPAAAPSRPRNSVYDSQRLCCELPGANGQCNASRRALAETLPHLNANVAQALICAGTTCRPPVSDPATLVELLREVPATASAD